MTIAPTLPIAPGCRATLEDGGIQWAWGHVWVWAHDHRWAVVEFQRHIAALTKTTPAVGCPYP